MTTKTNVAGLKAVTGVKAGGLGSSNHNQSGMAVRSKVKAGIGYTGSNYNQGAIPVQSRVKAGVGYGGGNHNQSGMAVRSNVNACGLGTTNHNQTAR